MPQALQFIIWTGTFLILLTPLVVAKQLYFPFVTSKVFYFYALTQVIFGAWLVLLLFEPKYRPKPNLILTALAIFLAVLFLSAILGVDFYESFWSQFDRMSGLLTWLHFFAFFITISSFFRDKKSWIKIFSFSVLTASIVGLIGLGENLDQVKTFSDRGGSTLGNSSYLGAYLLFNLFFSAFIYFTFDKGSKKTLALSGFLVILISLIFSGANAALISAFGGMILALCLYLVFSSSRKSGKILGAFVIAVFVLIFAFSGFFLFKDGSTVNKWFVENVGKARLVVWEGAWQGFLEKPVLGWGLENFDIVFVKHFNPCLYTDECGGEAWFDRAHNIVLDTAVTGGILGVLSYTFLLLSFLFVLWRGVFKIKNVSVLSASVFSSLIVAYFVQNLTFFDVASIQIMFFLMLAFGASLSFEFYEEEKNEYNKAVADKKFLGDFFEKTKVLWIAVVSVFTAYSLLFIVILPLNSAYNANKVFAVDYGTSEKKELYEKIISRSPIGNDEALSRLSANLVEFHTQGNFKHDYLEKVIEEFEFFIEELERSAKRNPEDFRTRLRLTELYNRYVVISARVQRVSEFQLTEESDKAVESAEKLVKLSPNHPQALIELSQAVIFKEEFEKALELNKKAIELEPGLINPYFFALHIALNLMNDKAEAEKIAQSAVSQNPLWESDFKAYLSVSD